MGSTKSFLTRLPNSSPVQFCGLATNSNPFSILPRKHEKTKTFRSIPKVFLSSSTTLERIRSGVSGLNVRLRTYAQYASMNEFTCSEHSERIRRSKKRSTGNQPYVSARKALSHSDIFLPSFPRRGFYIV